MSRKFLTYLSRLFKIRVMRYLEGVLLKVERFRIGRILRKSPELILVFTVGKVGSSAVYESFRGADGLNVPVFHVHSLNPQRLKERKAYYLHSKRRSVPFHLVQGEVLGELIPAYGGRIYVVALIRDPIQRELSGVFQDSFNFSDAIDLSGPEFQCAINAEMKKIVSVLPEVEWFDRELKEVFGVDFLGEEFDVEKGFKVLEGGSARVGLARVEGLSGCFSSFCAELFQRPVRVKLVSANLGAEKFYDEAYKSAKSWVRYSAEELEVILNTPFMKKFYPDMYNIIREKWISHRSIE